MEQIDKVKQAVVKIVSGFSTGSGFWCDDLEAVITNFHVVAGERQVAVQLSGGEKMVGNVIVVNPRCDIALVSVGRRLDAPHLAMGQQPLKQQEPVFALGYPYDLPFTVTKGIVSSTDYVDREIHYIQTDAAINPGNSGGPLVNQNGEIVGMNTMVLRNAQNIGFALPVEYLTEEIKLFKQDGVKDGFHVRCPSCLGLLSERVEYCDNCGVKLDTERLFQQRTLNPVEKFVEDVLARADINPVLARRGMPEYWLYHRGSALVRIFVYQNAFLYSTSPLGRLPRKNLVELFGFMLAESAPPYRFTMSDDTVYLSFRVHLADLQDPGQGERIGREMISLGHKADELDNLLQEKYGCLPLAQSGGE